jgi:hypothetical protein
MIVFLACILVWVFARKWRSEEYVPIGLLLGTQWALVALAASYSTLGPGKWQYRLLISFVSVALSALSIGIRGGAFLFARGLSNFSIAMSTCLLLQWMAVCLLIWRLAGRFGVKLRRPIQGEPPVATQFSIRGIMLLTAMCAVLLTVGRTLDAYSADDWIPWSYRDFTILLCLTLSAIATTIPLACSLLLHRFSFVTTTIVLAFIVCIPVLEGPLLAPLFPQLGLWADFDGPVQSRLGQKPDIISLLHAINFFLALWTLVIVGLVRYAGYRLIREARQS